MSMSMAAGPSSTSTSSSNVFQRQADATESVWLAIGRAAETMGDLERAQKAYERVLVMNPTSWRALTQAAHVCRCREDYPRAVDYFNRAIQIDDKNGDIWSSLGHCFLMQDELQSAYDAYQNALFHLPSPKEDAKLWYGIGILYDRYGSLQHAEEAFSSVLKMDQNFEKADEIYFRLGIIYKQLQRYSESLKCFDQILRNPPHPLSQMDIWFQIGHVYEQQKDYESARDAWDRVLTEAPNHAKVLQQLGWLYHQSAAPFVNQEVAVQYLTRSLATDPSDAQSWYLLGRAYMTSQKYNKAYEAYQQAVYRDGRNPTFWISIGVLYFQINQFKDALDAYSRAIRLNPYISEVWFDLGSLYESCNQQLKDAMDAYVRAKELDPTNTTVKERLELLNRHLQDPSIPLGAAPPPKDVHPTAYSNFQTQPADAPPPMRIHSNSTRHSPSRHGFSGAGAPLPNGAYQPGPRAHSRHSSPTPMRYGESTHPRGGDDYRGRALGQPQDVEMSDAHDPAYSTSRPGSSRGRRNSSHHHHQQPPSAGGGYSAILPPPNHPQNPGPQNVPSMLHHPQAQAQAPGSHRKHHNSSGQKTSQRSISPPPHQLMRVRGLSPGGGGAGAHGPSSSAAGGHYGSYGPSPASRYGGPNGNYERGRSPGAAASSASGGAYGAAMPADVDANWERERRYASGGLPPVNHASHHHHAHPDARGERDIDRERLPPGGGSGGPGPTVGSSSSIRVKEEPRDKNVRLPPPPPLGGSSSHQQQIQQMQQQQQHSNEGSGRRMAHDRHPSDDYDMRPPQSGPYGGGPGAGSGGPGGAPYDYDRNGVRNRSPVSGGHGGPNAHMPGSQHQPPHRSERRYDPLHDDRGPPRQSSPFHPGPIRHTEVSPVAYHDDRDRERRRTHDEGNAPPYGQQQPPPHHGQDSSNRRRSGRVDKDDAESVSGAEKGSNRKRGPASRNKKERDYGHPPYSAGSGVTPQPSSAFSAPPPPPQPTRSPGWQSSAFPQGESYDNRNRSRASSTSYGQQGPQPHQRYPSDANSTMNNHRQQPSAHTPVPPLVPNKQPVSRMMDEEYDDPDGAVGALMGLAGASSRALPASVTSTPATAPPMSSVSTVKGDSQSPVLRPSSQMTTRKRRRSGTASSTEQPPHTSLANSSSAASASAEPEKKKQRLEGSPGREGSVAMQTNGARRPSLEDDEEVDQLQREGSEKMQEDPRSPNGAHHDAGGPNGDKAGSPPSFRRTSTQQSSSMEMSNGPPSTGSQETMRHQSRSPTTPVGAKGPMVTSTSPPEKASEERESSRRSASHSHSRSNSMMNGTKASASPVS